VCLSVREDSVGIKTAKEVLEVYVAAAMAHAVLLWWSYPLVTSQMRTVIFRYWLPVRGSYSVTRTVVTTALVSNVIITRK
jgi:hypothetical protein